MQPPCSSVGTGQGREDPCQGAQGVWGRGGGSASQCAPGTAEAFPGCCLLCWGGESPSACGSCSGSLHPTRLRRPRGLARGRWRGSLAGGGCVCPRLPSGCSPPLRPPGGCCLFAGGLPPPALAPAALQPLAAVAMAMGGRFSPASRDARLQRSSARPLKRSAERAAGEPPPAPGRSSAAAEVAASPARGLSAVPRHGAVPRDAGSPGAPEPCPEQGQPSLRRQSILGLVPFSSQTPPNRLTPGCREATTPLIRKKSLNGKVVRIHPSVTQALS